MTTMTTMTRLVRTVRTLCTNLDCPLSKTGNPCE